MAQAGDDRYELESSPLDWKASICSRMTRSTLAGESAIAASSTDSTGFSLNILAELAGEGHCAAKVCISDCKSFIDNLDSKNPQAQDKRRLIDILSCAEEDLVNGDIRGSSDWPFLRCLSAFQKADFLTKSQNASMLANSRPHHILTFNLDLLAKLVEKIDTRLGSVKESPLI